MSIKKMVLARRISQTFFWLVFVYILWSTTYPLTGALPPETFFVFDPLLIFITGLSERILLSGMLTAAITLLVSIVAGRFFCGWVCPLGAMLDFSGACFPRAWRVPDRTVRRFIVVKYVLLVVIVGCAAAGIQFAWGLDPIVIAARFIALNFIPAMTVTIDRLFIALLNALHRPEMLFDMYRNLQESLLGIRVSYVEHAATIFFMSVLLMLSCGIAARLWCRVLCPLGALLALVGRAPWLQRAITGCVSCQRCVPACRMGAIDDHAQYDPAECILCMDCVYACAPRVTRFGFLNKKTPRTGSQAANTAGQLSRRKFLTLMAGAAVPAFALRAWSNPLRTHPVIRPPGARAEDVFCGQCVRCGNCMKVCPTNALHPVFLQAGPAGVWTPQVLPQIGYCEYNCTLCGTVCPTAAIEKISLADKQSLKIGIAEIDRAVCLPWAKNTACLVCEEHCPIPRKAIKLTAVMVDGKVLQRPVVDPRLCIGCGICQSKCPVSPVRAIRVLPV